MGDLLWVFQRCRWASLGNYLEPSNVVGERRSTMAKKLAGKVALVTGASSGIGEATAIALAEESARVAALARRSDRLEQVVKRIKDAGGEAVSLVADVTNEIQLREAIRQAKEIFGRIDILV